MIRLSYLRIPLGSMTPKASDKDVEVINVKTRYEQGTDGKPDLEKPLGYSLEFLGIKACTQNVKLPLTAKTSVEKIKELIDAQCTVRCKFESMDSRIYEIRNADNTTVVLSCKADDVEITSTESLDDFDAIEI